LDEGLLRPARATEHATASWFGYPVICRERRVRDELRKSLNAHGIETRPIICGNMARQPAMAHVAHRLADALPGADTIMDCGLVWGLHPALTAEQLEYLAEVVCRLGTLV
jgi:CDP-6-deoxy-D-xylo-4-hexulose-3-dehydrase